MKNWVGYHVRGLSKAEQRRRYVFDCRLKGLHPIPEIPKEYKDGEWDEQFGMWTKVPCRIRDNGAYEPYLPAAMGQLRARVPTMPPSNNKRP